MTLRAILMDFDGVVADSEPLHFELFRVLLGEWGLSLSKEDYYKSYLGLDDGACFEAVFRDRGQALSATERARLIKQKNARMLKRLRTQSSLLPGVADFVHSAHDLFLCIVSGALRSEIELVLKEGGLAPFFQVIVGAEDVSQGKPSPEGFLKAVRLLNRDFVPESEILLPTESLAIEDSPWGIEAARAAEVRCAALATSYPAERLSGADWIFRDWGEVKIQSLRELFQ